MKKIKLPKFWIAVNSIPLFWAISSIQIDSGTFQRIG